MSVTQTLITAAIGVLTVAGAYFAARLQRPKIKAESEEIIGKAYKGLIEELRADIAAVRLDLEYERKRSYALEEWSKALTLQVIELGGVPVLYSDYRQAD